MLKRSAGILPYKYIDEDVYIYLEHPGGPFWKGKDEWSICKGEYTEEKAIDAAVREFYEESGTKVDKDKLTYLTSYKINKRKIVTLYITNMDIDVSKMTSNTFTREYPKDSGIINEYPEMDEAKWFSLNDAKGKIFPSQLKLLRKFEEYIK